jgi:ABC-type nitrate/sulfonate/bicarbonate transport system substrate-binding protein
MATLQALKVGAVSRNYFNMPLWIAEHKGLFEHEGLDVSIELYEPIDEVTERLQDGRLDLALGVTEHVILGRERGADQEIIGGNVNRLPFSLIARADIGCIEDLRGKTIGVSSIDAGSSSLVMKILSAQGLEYPRDYNLLAVGPILARWRMLQSGEIDAGLQGIPMNYIAQDQGYRSLCEPRQQFPWFQFTSLNVRAGWAATNTELVVAFLKAYIAAHEWFYANKDGCTAIAMQECTISHAYAERAWIEITESEIFPRDAAANVESVQTLIEVSALIRALPSRARIKAENYINRSYVDQAKRER